LNHTNQGGNVPPPLTDLPDPSDLHVRLSRHGPLDWGDQIPSIAEIAKLHGIRATRKSLELLEQAVSTEPRITATVLAALSRDSSPYQLESRVKSPESLARKLQDLQRSRSYRPPEDLLRYTALTELPDTLVNAARHTADKLNQAGWRVTYAMQSYTEGSRYKGIHTLLKTPTGDRVEVQFHSAASAKIKEATTPWYEIERSGQASPAERTAARRECIRLSATLVEPPGIAGMIELGGRRVAVNNYSDSRKPPKPSIEPHQRQPDSQAPTKAATSRNEGVSR
jgi:hypothetical protein